MTSYQSSNSRTLSIDMYIVAEQLCQIPSQVDLKLRSLPKKMRRDKRPVHDSPYVNSSRHLLLSGEVSRVAEAGEVQMLVSEVERRKFTQMKILNDWNGNICTESTLSHY